MAKIKKLKENELIGGTSNEDVYPITHTKAIYDSNNVQLDKRLKDNENTLLKLREYVDDLSSLKVTDFTMTQMGTYETGTIIYVQDFSWKYNKDNIVNQTINNISIPTSLRKLSTESLIQEDTLFTLVASNGKEETLDTVSINFVDYIYYGTASDSIISRLKINPSAGAITVDAKENEYIWIFIPDSAGYSKILYNNWDSTSDFHKESAVFRTDTNIEVQGIMYESKNHSLNNIILKFE